MNRKGNEYPEVNIILYLIEMIRNAADRILNPILLTAHGVRCDGSVKGIRGIPTIRRSRRGGIRIGKDFRANAGRSRNMIGSGSRLLLRTVGEGQIRIGDHVGMSNCAIVSYDSVTIGDDVMIGGGVRIWDSDFHPTDFAARTSDYTDSGAHAPVTIGNGAFIGADSLILKGVTIGEKAVIGAGSVVTKDVPAGETWAGNPARKIK